MRLTLDEDSLPWILNDVDSFDIQARLNKSVKDVFFYGCSGDGQGDGDWDKVGQAIGNLQALEKLCICTNFGNDDEAMPTSDWEILARILSHVR
jgi:hypothetical protein